MQIASKKVLFGYPAVSNRQVVFVGLFLGAVMCTSLQSANAAMTDAAITPSSSPVAALTTPPSTGSLITLDFTRAAVSDILTMIGREGNVDIIIGEDVIGTLKSVHLTDKTADQAIRMVAQSAGIPWKKLDSHTYLVGKAATPDNVASLADPDGGGTTASPQSDFGDLSLGLLKPAPQSSEAVTTTASVVLSNVKPSIMAYWLDPSHQPVPADFKKSDERARLMGSEYTKPQIISTQPKNDASGNMPNQVAPWAQPGSGYLPFNPYTQAHNQTTGGGSNSGSGSGSGSVTGNQDLLASGAATVALPQGVDNIIAIDAQNALLVRGTDEGIDRIREIISFLDRPIQQVEIESQFVLVETNALKQFGLTFTDVSSSPTTPKDTITGTPLTGSINVSITRGNVRASLAAAEQAGLARTVQGPRVTTFNNLTAQLVSIITDSRPITTTTIIQNQNGNPTTVTSTSFIGVNSGTVLTVIPTINRDGTVTIALQPIVLASTLEKDLSSNVQIQEINTSANIKDGDTLAIGGLRTTKYINADGKIPFLGNLPLIGGLFRSRDRTQRESELVIFVTAHVKRRIDDPVPGT